MAEAEAFAAKARADAIGTDNLIRQAVVTALVEIARESKTPLVPSVIVTGGADGAANALCGIPGLLLAMAAKNSATGNPPGRSVRATLARVAPTL